MNSPAKYLSAEARRAATVEAVIQLAAQTPPSEITTTAIAQHMGVTQGALFKHFPTKEAILEAVMVWVAEHLLSRVDEAAHAAQAHDGAIAALEAICRAHVDLVGEHPGAPRMLFGELQRSEMTAPKRVVQTLLGHYGARLQQWLAQGQAQGQVAGALDCVTAVTLFIGSLQGLVMQSMLAGDVLHMRRQAAPVFALYRRAVMAVPAGDAP